MQQRQCAEKQALEDFDSVEADEAGKVEPALKIETLVLGVVQWSLASGFKTQEREPTEATVFSSGKRLLSAVLTD